MHARGEAPRNRALLALQAPLRLRAPCDLFNGGLKNSGDLFHRQRSVCNEFGDRGVTPLFKALFQSRFHTLPEDLIAHVVHLANPLLSFLEIARPLCQYGAPHGGRVSTYEVMHHRAEVGVTVIIRRVHVHDMRPILKEQPYPRFGTLANTSNPPRSRGPA